METVRVLPIQVVTQDVRLFQLACVRPLRAMLHSIKQLSNGFSRVSCGSWIILTEI